MQKEKTTTYDDLVKILQDNIDTGNLTKITGNSLRSTLSRVLKEVYNDRWRQITLDQINIEQLLVQYSNSVKDKYSPRDLMITRSRIRRIFRIAREDGENIKNQKKTTKNLEVKLPNESIRFMTETYNILNSMFLHTLEKTIFNPAGAKHNTYYAIPATTDKIAGLSLPKDLTIAELKRIRNLIDGIFICEIYQKKGGPD